MENKKESWAPLKVNISNLKSTMHHTFNTSRSPLLWDMQILVYELVMLTESRKV